MEERLADVTAQTQRGDWIGTAALDMSPADPVEDVLGIDRTKYMVVAFKMDRGGAFETVTVYAVSRDVFNERVGDLPTLSQVHEGQIAVTEIRHVPVSFDKLIASFKRCSIAFKERGSDERGDKFVVERSASMSREAEPHEQL